MLEFNVTGQTIKRTDDFKPVAKSHDYLYAKFNFLTGEWTGVKTAIFTNATDSYEVLLDEYDKCLVPWEVLDEAGIIFVSVYCGNLVTGNIVPIVVYETIYTGENEYPPTPNVYYQIIERLNKLEERAKDGTGGS